MTRRSRKDSQTFDTHFGSLVALAEKWRAEFAAHRQAGSPGYLVSHRLLEFIGGLLGFVLPFLRVASAWPI